MGTGDSPIEVPVDWLGQEDLTVFLERVNVLPPVIVPYTSPPGCFAVGLEYHDGKASILVSDEPEKCTWKDDRLWFCNVPAECRALFRTAVIQR